jgi:serine acetyltransferase
MRENVIGNGYKISAMAVVAGNHYPMVQVVVVPAEPSFLI